MMDEKFIIEKAHDMGLTFAKNFNGWTYALMDAYWIGYFSTVDDICKFLDISDKQKGGDRE